MQVWDPHNPEWNQSLFENLILSIKLSLSLFSAEITKHMYECILTSGIKNTVQLSIKLKLNIHEILPSNM